MRIVHLSDLHFGRHRRQLADGLAADIKAQNANLVVVSGDFTQTGTTEEFAQAREFLDTLEAPFFAVPGNHDVPALNLIRRFLTPYRLYRRYISSELEPFAKMDGVAIAGIKTSRRARFETNWANGSISLRQLVELERRFQDAPRDAVRIVVAHHPLLGPETAPAKEMEPVRRAERALEVFARLGIRLVLSGHFHLSYVRRRERGQVVEGVPSGLRRAATAPILVAQASSTISTRLRGEPNAYNLVDVDEGKIAVTVREWRDEGWHTREKAAATS
jgi:3',5'-cyclic AMP phosphodiesterase CpdA